MVRSTWDELTGALNDTDLALITAYRELCLALPDVEEQVHKTEVQYRVARIFTSAYVKSHYLEVAIDLLREASHPQLRTAFHTTKKVITHRLTLTTVAQVRSLRTLLREARDDVAPGFR